MSAKIATAINDVMQKVGYVQKTGKNQFHGYKYAGEGALLAVLRPAMVEAGLILLPSVTSVSEPDTFGNVTIRVEYTIVHRDGDIWPEKVVGYGVGNDYSPKSGRIGDKGYYKAITGANKYVLFKLFQIETGDDPEVAAPHESEEGPSAGDAHQMQARRQYDRQQQAAQRSVERAKMPEAPEPDTRGMGDAGDPSGDVPHNPETGEIAQSVPLLTDAESRSTADAMLDKLSKIAREPKRSTLQVWARGNKPLKDRLQPAHRAEVEAVVAGIKTAIKAAEQTGQSLDQQQAAE